MVFSAAAVGLAGWLITRTAEPGHRLVARRSGPTRSFFAAGPLAAGPLRVATDPVTYAYYWMPAVSGSAGR